MDWGTILEKYGIPIMGIILPLIGGALTSIFAYRRGRNSAFREKLYDRLLDGYVELSDVTEEYRSVIDSYMARTNVQRQTGSSLDDMLTQWSNDLLNADVNYNKVRRKLSIFMPLQVYTASNDFFLAALEIVNLLHFDRQKFLQDDWDYLEKVRQSHVRLRKALRQTLGTDKLAKELDETFNPGFQPWQRILNKFRRKQGTTSPHSAIE